MRALLTLLLVACGSGNPNYPPDLPLPDEYRVCEVDEDCTVVELGYCDHCNGGMIAAVAVDKKDEAWETFHEEPPPGKDVGCTLMGCAPWDSICTDGLCEARELGMGGTPPSE